MSQLHTCMLNIHGLLCDMLLRRFQKGTSVAWRTHEGAWVGWGGGIQMPNGARPIPRIGGQARSLLRAEHPACQTRTIP